MASHQAEAAEAQQEVTAAAVREQQPTRDSAAAAALLRPGFTCKSDDLRTPLLSGDAGDEARVGAQSAHSTIGDCYGARSC